jgi:hypothetical protein
MYDIRTEVDNENNAKNDTKNNTKNDNHDNNDNENNTCIIYVPRSTAFHGSSKYDPPGWCTAALTTGTSAAPAACTHKTPLSFFKCFSYVCPELVLVN